MKKGLKSVPTLSAKEIANKHGISVAYVLKQIAKGVKIEKEHTKSTAEANEIARDHLGERPDYYVKLGKMEKSKVVKEESFTGGVRGLGYVSGDPAGTDYVQSYINTNSMAYEDENGHKLEWIKKQHANLHNKRLGYKFFDPTSIDKVKNFVTEGISAGPERDTTGYQVGDLGGGRTLMRPLDVKEGAKLDKAKKAVAAGLTAANLYTAGDVMSRASEGRGGTKGDVIRMATTLPGAAGWAATGVHYAKKAYDKVKQMKEDKDPCWKGYEMVGMKKKGSRKVPNCVPVEEGWASIGHAYDWAGDRNPKAKFYGNKPKATTTKNDEKDDTYKDSNKGKKVKFAKTVKEEQIDELKAETLGSYIKKAAASRKEALNKGGAKADVQTWGKRQKGITTAIKKLTNEELMDTKEQIQEAIGNIMEDNLHEMKENFLAVLQEKAIEKLEERKKEIAANYFAQD